MIRLPQLNLDDWEPFADGKIVDEASDILGRRVHIEDNHRFAKLPKEWQHGVVSMQQHFVVKRLVDPTRNHFFDLCKIHDHTERIELIRLEADDRSAVVAVQMPALAVIVQQAMAVAESDLARHAKHESSPAY